MTIDRAGSDHEDEVRLDDGTATQRIRAVENGNLISRRGVLWRAGIATAVGAATLTGLDQQRAEAASGGTFVLGQANSASTETALQATSATVGFSQLLALDGTNVTRTTLDVTGPTGGTAINGHVASGVGASGVSTSGIGVAGTSTSGTGVRGVSTSGLALSASSGSGGGVQADAPTFHLRLSNTANRNAPTGDAIAHQRGDIVETTAGDLWLCTSAGTPGTWRKLGGPATAGALHVLPVPVRIYDSRPGFAPNIAPQTPLSANVARPLDLKGNSSHVPAGAIAALVNLLVVDSTSTAPPNLVLWANGATKPTANTMVWDQTAKRASSLAVTALDAQAKCQVAASVQTDLVVDVIGYYR